jgi:uncharacterized protein (DUF2336 family)
MTSRLTPNDIESLLKNPSAEMRAGIAAKVADTFDGAMLSARERVLAEQILRLMVKDAAERVRLALAMSLSHSTDVPRDVALALAHDIDDVAAPFLAATPALSEKDLVEIVRASSGTKQQAIARRPEIPTQLADALVETGGREVVRVLIRNPGAQLTEATYGRILDRHADDPEITEPMVRRNELPLTVAERLVAVVTDQLRSHLIRHHKVPSHVAERLAAQSRERATVGLVGDSGMDGVRVSELVQQLRTSGRLTPSLLLRAACTGDMRLCEEAFAQLAGVPVHKAWILLHDAGPLGLRAVYERAKLPEFLYSAFRVAIDVYHETELDGGPQDRERFERRMLERILTQYDNLDTDDLGFLLDRLTHIAAEHEQDQAFEGPRLRPGSSAEDDVAYI